jgi:cell division topological specificity factor MinE
VNGARQERSAVAGAAKLGDANSLSLQEKISFTWGLFFPAQEAKDARNDAKRRLRMVLVADRCALSPQALSDMKEAIVRAVSDFVVVDAGEGNVDVTLQTNEEDAGALFSISIPVKRVRAGASAEDDE